MEPAARAMFTGLELGMGYSDLMRAVFEGLVLCRPRLLRGDGRHSRGSAHHRRGGALQALRLILASALKARVRTVTREEAGAAGAAMMAAVQQKLYPSLEACAAQWVDPLLGSVTPPDSDLAEGL